MRQYRTYRSNVSGKREDRAVTAVLCSIPTPTDDSLTIIITIKNKRVTALIDTGATKSFMATDVAEEVGLSPHPTQARISAAVLHIKPINEAPTAPIGEGITFVHGTPAEQQQIAALLRRYASNIFQWSGKHGLFPQHVASLPTNGEDPEPSRRIRLSPDKRPSFQHIIDNYTRAVKPATAIIWSPEATEAFEVLKQAIANAARLERFDPAWDTEIHCDAYTLVHRPGKTLTGPDALSRIRLNTIQLKEIPNESERQDIIDEYHIEMGHPSWKRTFHQLRQRYTWPEMRTQIFKRLGSFEIIHSDGAAVFSSAAFKRFTKANQMEVHIAQPYHPEGNGACERTIKSLTAILAKTAPNATSWDQVLYKATMAYNRTPHSTTGLSPLELWHKKPMPTPADIKFNAPPRDISQQLQAVQQTARDRQSQYIKQANKRKLPPFHVGQMVTLRPRLKTTERHAAHRRFLPKRYGPFKVLAINDEDRPRFRLGYETDDGSDHPHGPAETDEHPSDDENATHQSDSHNHAAHDALAPQGSSSSPAHGTNHDARSRTDRRLPSPNQMRPSPVSSKELLLPESVAEPPSPQPQPDVTAARNAAGSSSPHRHPRHPHQLLKWKRTSSRQASCSHNHSADRGPSPTRTDEDMSTFSLANAHHRHRPKRRRRRPTRYHNQKSNGTMLAVKRVLAPVSLQQWRHFKSNVVKTIGEKGTKDSSEWAVKIKVFTAALSHVPTDGWSRDAIVKGAKSIGLPSVAHGLFNDGAVDLVAFFYLKCNEDLTKWMEQEVERSAGSSQIHCSKTDLIRDSVKHRLEMILPVEAQWPQAMSLLALNPRTGLLVLSDLMDDIWHVAGDDESQDLNWYSKRLGLTALYKSTEIFMLQDVSPEKSNTWEFLDRRIENLFAMSNFAENAEVALAFSTKAAKGLGLSCKADHEDLGSQLQNVNKVKRRAEKLELTFKNLKMLLLVKEMELHSTKGTMIDALD
ncbi:unnamed protein product [Notodromas monacha]|uniref:Ubiquinone biosynthesis protein n=1 Tax=Notodromas monacha TaxID=399045 RepID=A0A7R9BYA9_9CRUS|nr:unnamed protein product [Notodromas monacha]CAG0923616.1 unnamed protein product [Notodromas monacha]